MSTVNNQWLLTEHEAVTLALLTGRRTAMLLRKRPDGMVPGDTVHVRAEGVDRIVGSLTVDAVKGSAPVARYWKAAGYESAGAAVREFGSPAAAVVTFVGPCDLDGSMRVDAPMVRLQRVPLTRSAGLDMEDGGK